MKEQRFGASGLLLLVVAVSNEEHIERYYEINAEVVSIQSADVTGCRYAFCLIV